MAGERSIVQLQVLTLMVILRTALCAGKRDRAR
jgi:hypothetical protein